MKWECELISFEVPPLGYRPAGQGNGKHVCLSRLLSRPDLGLRSGFAIGRPNQVSGGNYPCVFEAYFTSFFCSTQIGINRKIHLSLSVPPRVAAS